jgi:glycosyltransferase involved in cell wall biosynthesis
MKIALVKHLLTLRPRVADRANIKVIPFLEAGISENLFYSHRNNKPSKKFDFIYPASGEPHKNHQNLIDAFIILAEQGHYPSLLLTLNERSDSGLLRRIEVQKFKYKLKIHNMGFLPHHELLGLYLEARYLIYPSLYESFGIPLIEAKQAGLSIVAGELDYVRDSVDPYEVFDPHSPVSISRAIKRSLGIFDDISTVVNADSFLSQIYVKV